jgi:methylated-DNA-[protein]-cysteine S-methyltransferase
MRYAVLDTPVGCVTVASSDKGLSSLRFGNTVPAGGTIDRVANSVFLDQISEYFQGTRTIFDFPLDVKGTPFQLAVWNALTQIPYGETRAYGAIAKFIGKPGAARAVGMANHDNPIAVVIPCHRVVGQNGALTGYAGGLELKQKLLSIEKRTLFT